MYCSEQCQQEAWPNHQQMCVRAQITADDLENGYIGDTKYIQEIRGPVSMATFEYNGVRWFLFGDEHTPTEDQVLPGDEVDVVVHNEKLMFTDGIPIIWSIERVLFNMFSRVKRQGGNAHFYLEMPYLVRPTEKVQPVAGRDYIYSIFDVFSDCFYAGYLPEQSTCAFSPEVEFHYVDYRQHGKTLDPSLAMFFMIRLCFQSNTDVSINVLAILGRANLFELQKVAYLTMFNSSTVRTTMHDLWQETLSAILTIAAPSMNSLDRFTKNDALNLYDLATRALAYINTLPEGYSKIHKQMQKLEPTIRQQLEKYFTDMNGQLEMQYKADHDGVFQDILSNFQKYGNEDIEYILEVIISNEAKIMDAYGIARALSRPTTNLNVAYLGDNHVRTWVEVFRYLGVERINGINKKKDPSNVPYLSKTLSLKSKVIFDIIRRYL